MENEFIFTEVFAVVFLLLSVAMLATAIYSKRKRFDSALDCSKVYVLIRFLWLLYGVAMIVAFGTEMTIKMM